MLFVSYNTARHVAKKYTQYGKPEILQQRQDYISEHTLFLFERIITPLRKI